MTPYQQNIIDYLKQGAKLQSSEGENYKTWLVFPDGKTKTVRKDSAEKICTEYSGKLVFGKPEGIYWKQTKIKDQ